MKTSSWYLKKPDGTIYGPVRLSDLKLWVRDSRVAPVDQLSTDQQEWMPAPELAALEMNYLVRYRSGTDYGPVHLRALGELIMDGDVPLDEPIFNKTTQITLPACVVAIRGLMTEEPPDAAPTSDVGGRDAAELHAEYEAVLNGITAELKAAKEEQAALEAEVRRLNEQREAMESSVRDLTEEVEQARQDKSGAEQWEEDRQRLQRALDEALREQQQEKAADHEQSHADKSKAELRMAELEEQLKQARQETGTARDDVAALQEKLKASAEHARQAAANVEERVRARTEQMTAQLEKEIARRGQAEREADKGVQEAIGSSTAELKKQLEEERERHRIKEASLQQRLGQFDGELKDKVQDLVRAKQEAQSARQVALTGAAGSGTNAVVRMALVQAKSRALRSGAVMHAPRSPARKASMVEQARAQTRVQPSKRHGMSGGR